jgi:hypothetical protein
MALTKLTSNLIEGGTGTDWVTAIQTSNFTAEAGKGYFVNTTSQVLYVNLPVGVVGMEITIQDYAGTFATNKVILNANGSEKIQGSALEGRINTNNATAVLIYQDATKGWTSQDVELNATIISWATPTGQSLTYSTPSPQSSQGAAAATFPTTTFTATLAGSTISGTATIAGLPSGITAAQTITGSGAGNILTVTLTGVFPSADSLNTALTLSGLTVDTPVPVDYLVVAGGGGGGGVGGGGGAGGYRTNYQGTALNLYTSTNYTVTIGGGGAPSATNNPWNGDGAIGANGSNSVFSTITSAGGGGGAGGTNNGRSGGSGGGSRAGTVGSGNTPSVTPAQGFSGGAVGSQYGGGGGGASEAGNTDGDTHGGDGNANAISGTSIYYAGGGAGGGGGATGGLGGGAASGANAGTVNTGGGGGGGTWTNNSNITTQRGGAGGSGIVIIRYPSSFAITNPGSGLTFTTATVGSDYVTTFTDGTGNIQFN